MALFNRILMGSVHRPYLRTCTFKFQISPTVTAFREHCRSLFLAEKFISEHMC